MLSLLINTSLCAPKCDESLTGSWYSFKVVIKKKAIKKKEKENHGGMKMLRSRVKKKGDDVSHVSLDEISHSKKTDQNKEAGAQWAY